jgi:hypothetical protein
MLVHILCDVGTYSQFREGLHLLCLCFFKQLYGNTVVPPYPLVQYLRFIAARK